MGMTSAHADPKYDSVVACLKQQKMGKFTIPSVNRRPVKMDVLPMHLQSKASTKINGGIYKTPVQVSVQRFVYPRL